MKTHISLSLFITFSLYRVAFSQTFTHTANIPKVEKDGFYKISISPELGEFLSEDFSNLRIIDAHNKEVPYLIDEDIPYTSKLQFHPYTILEKKQKPLCCTSLVLKNPNRAPINNISLIIKNAEVTKQATLSGSDDRKQWYALKEHFTFDYINNANETTEVKIIDFPLSNYLYYSLQIDDSTTSPLNIINAGFYDVQSETGKYVEIPGMSYKVTDRAEEKSTFVYLKFSNARFVDKIELKIVGVPFFRRNATLYIPKVVYNKKGNKKTKLDYNEYVDHVEVSSTHATTLSLYKKKTKELLLVIDNQDNPPLSVENAKAYQLNRVLSAWLKKNDAYSIKFGANLKSPLYDLSYFRDSIPEEVPILKPESVTLTPVLKTKHDSPTLFTSRLLIWIAIVGVIVILGFMSMKMIRETSRKG